MATQLFSNNASSILTSSVSPVEGVISITPGDGALFSDPGGGGDWELVTLIGSNGIEIVKVTDRSVDALTVERAQEGTTALDFAIGDQVEARLTKGTMEELQNASGGGFGLVPATVVEMNSAHGGSHTWNIDTEGFLELRIDAKVTGNLTINASNLAASAIIHNKMLLLVGGDGGGGPVSVNISNQLGDMYYIDTHLGTAVKLSVGSNHNLTLQNQVLVFDITASNTEFDDSFTQGIDSLVLSKISQGGFTIVAPGGGGE